MDLINNMTIEDRIKNIKRTNITCIFHNDEQLTRDELDYRIFQTIAYGGFLATNSPQISKYMNNDCYYYHKNSSNFITHGIDKKQEYNNFNKWKCMEMIKQNHTYVKRLESILWMLMRL